MNAFRKRRPKLFYGLVIGGLLLACGAIGSLFDDGTGVSVTPTTPPTLAPSSTAAFTATTRPTWTPKPTATDKPTELPTVALAEPVRIATLDISTVSVATNTPFVFRTLPPATAGCTCSRDYNCSDFSRRSQAQACYNSCGGNNWSGLDNDGDGQACESLP